LGGAVPPQPCCAFVLGCCGFIGGGSGGAVPPNMLCRCFRGGLGGWSPPNHVVPLFWLLWINRGGFGGGGPPQPCCAFVLQYCRLLWVSNPNPNVVSSWWSSLNSLCFGGGSGGQGANCVFTEGGLGGDFPPQGKKRMQHDYCILLPSWSVAPSKAQQADSF
jgi:hypothetical protein